MSLNFKENAIESFGTNSNTSNITSVNLDLSNASGATDGTYGFIVVTASFNTTSETSTTLRATFKDTSGATISGFYVALDNTTSHGGGNYSASNHGFNRIDTPHGAANISSFNGERHNFMMHIAINGNGDDASEAQGYCYASCTYSIQNTSGIINANFADMSIFQNENLNAVDKVGIYSLFKGS